MRANRLPLQRRIGDVFRKHREAKHWSQEEFADRMEMHRAHYGLIERGGKDLQLSTLERIAAGLGEPVWALMREAEET